MKLFPWIRKKTSKINFEEEKLVACYFAVITDHDKWYSGDEVYWESSVRKLPGIRILVKKGSAYTYYYEPEEALKSDGKYYYDRVKFLDGVGNRIVIPLYNGLPIQYLNEIKLTAEELATKRITLERIKELENLLNSKNEI